MLRQGSEMDIVVHYMKGRGCAISGGLRQSKEGAEGGESNMESRQNHAKGDAGINLWSNKGVLPNSGGKGTPNWEGERGIFFHRAIMVDVTLKGRKRKKWCLQPFDWGEIDSKYNREFCIRRKKKEKKDYLLHTSRTEKQFKSEDQEKKPDH